MTNAEKEECFFQFIKGHDTLAHLTYGDAIEGQQWVAILPSDESLIDGMIANLPEQNPVVITPDWDQVYENFINLDHNKEAITYIKGLVVGLDTNKKIANFITKHALQKIRDCNVQSDKVYVVISKDFAKTWFDTVIEE